MCFGLAGMVIPSGSTSVLWFLAGMVILIWLGWQLVEVFMGFVRLAEGRVLRVFDIVKRGRMRFASGLFPTNQRGFV